MAIKRGKANVAPFPIKYERGNLVNPTPEQAEREEASRERHGVEQIYRRMRGKRSPATTRPIASSSRRWASSPSTWPTAQTSTRAQ